MHQQQRNRRRRYTRNPRRLTDGFGRVIAQFVFHFIRQTFDFLVIQSLWNVRGFVVGVLADFLFLPLDVTRVFDVNFYLLADEFVFYRIVVQCLLGLESCVVYIHQGVVCDIRAAQQIGQIVFALNRFAK